MGDIYGSNIFFTHFENSNFGQFAIFLANLRYFWPWRSSEGPKGPDLVPTATGWSDWVNYIHIMCSGPLWDLYGTPGASKRAHFGPERPFWWPQRSSVSPGNGRDGPNGVRNTSTQCVWVGRIHIMHLGPLTDLYGTPGAPKRARALSRAQLASNQHVQHGSTESTRASCLSFLSQLKREQQEQGDFLEGPLQVRYT